MKTVVICTNCKFEYHYNTDDMNLIHPIRCPNCKVFVDRDLFEKEREKDRKNFELARMERIAPIKMSQYSEDVGKKSLQTPGVKNGWFKKLILMKASSMGIIRNIALKTAIKKALLDVDKDIEKMLELPDVKLFGEAVMIYAKHNPFVDKDLIAETWEATFCGIVAKRAQGEMPSNYLIQSQRDLTTLISLISEWVASRGGNAVNIYREFSENRNESQSSASEAKETKSKDRFISYDDGTVLDTQTKLMWAAHDNGSNINWADAKSYCCQIYRGGGYIDWRMPTQDELAGLYAGGAYKDRIKLTMTWVWASETRGFTAAYVGFDVGEQDWGPQSISNTYRALPVRSCK